MLVWKLDTFLSALSSALQWLWPFLSGSVVSSSNNTGSVENVYLEHKDLSSTIRTFSTEPWSYVQIMHKSALGGHFWRLAQLAAIEQLEQLGGL